MAPTQLGNSQGDQNVGSLWLVATAGSSLAYSDSSAIQVPIRTVLRLYSMRDNEQTVSMANNAALSIAWPRMIQRMVCIVG